MAKVEFHAARSPQTEGFTISGNRTEGSFGHALVSVTVYPANSRGKDDILAALAEITQLIRDEAL
jgi:hypothetical protein